MPILKYEQCYHHSILNYKSPMNWLKIKIGIDRSPQNCFWSSLDQLLDRPEPDLGVDDVATNSQIIRLKRGSHITSTFTSFHSHVAWSEFHWWSSCCNGVILRKNWSVEDCAAAAVAQSVKRSELKSLKEVQLNWLEFDSRSRHRSLGKTILVMPSEGVGGETHVHRNKCPVVLVAK